MMQELEAHAGSRYGARTWLSWLEMDESARQQVANAASQPYVIDDIMVMPDAHGGYGLPVGGVMATDGSVVPYAVGMDKGCGMFAARLNIRREDIVDKLDVIAKEISRRVPNGVGQQHKSQVADDAMPLLGDHGGGRALNVVWDHMDRAAYQMGTLGSGNHFIELQYDEMGYVCVMIHCGSRNLGKQVADHYSKVAAAMCRRWYSKADNSDLAFLPRKTQEWVNYMADMRYCIDYAAMNRKAIMKAVLITLIDALGKHDLAMNFGTDICHNFAAFEHHKGKDVLVHRKGACHVPKGRIGIIPGSMATGGYIVKGLGNVQAYDSCSHGAGRTMSRKMAQRMLSMENEQAILAEAGTTTQLTDLAESDGAYKDLDVVMELQKDLVEIVHHLKPMKTIKGSTT